MRWLRTLAALLLAATCAWANAGSGDYERGHRDGYADRDYREKDRSNKDYAAGYKAGESLRRHGGKDREAYDRGYEDGRNDRSARGQDRGNKHYAEGFKAGRAAARESAPSAQGRPANPAAATAVGAPARGLESGMRARGFERQTNVKKGDATISTWINRSSNECFRAVTSRGVISSMTSAEYSQCL